MKTISTLSNIAYILAGLALPFELGAYLIALGILSGIHHWYIDSEWRIYTIVLDYIGMYAVAIALITTAWGVSLLISGPAAALIGIAFKASRTWIAILIGGALISLGIHGGLSQVLHVSAFLAVAYVFNFLGDTDSHKQYHYVIHSALHVITAYAILLGFQYLAG